MGDTLLGLPELIADVVALWLLLVLVLMLCHLRTAC